MRHVSNGIFFKGFKLALISKGLRLAGKVNINGVGFQACPDFKGIKTSLVVEFAFHGVFQACPDFKGIKTFLPRGHTAPLRFQACPDFKGIKTL